MSEEKVQSLLENNANSQLTNAACHALESCSFVCPWSRSRRLEPAGERSQSLGLARTHAGCRTTPARRGRTPGRGTRTALGAPSCPGGVDGSAGSVPEWGFCGGSLQWERGGSSPCRAAPCFRAGTPGLRGWQQRGPRQVLLTSRPGSAQPPGHAPRSQHSRGRGGRSPRSTALPAAA